jgi:hypothetical protein
MGRSRFGRSGARYKSIVEVRALFGFKEDNPLSKINYKELVDDYRFPEPSRCCFEPDGRSLCRKLHQNGYVVRLQDETVTIIGIDCANNHFDAEHQIHSDRAKHENKKLYSESLARVQQMLADKEANMERIRAAHANLKQLKVRTDAFLRESGSKCASKLQAMARDGRRNVVIKGVRIRPYEEDGQQRQERTELEITVGSINGLAVLRPSSCQDIFDRMNAVVRAYDAAEKMEHPVPSRSLNKIRSVLSDVDRILEDADALLSVEKNFLANDFVPLPFLGSDVNERIKLTRFVAKDSGRLRGKEWMQAQEAALLKTYGVDRLIW